MAGAYTLAMASNYNLARRPAVVLVKDGAAQLIQRRETYADLVARLALEQRDRLMGDTDLRSNAATFPPAGRRFFKYDALGNDYIVLDPADWPEPPAAEAIRRICDRHRGVGSDGILWGPTSSGPTFHCSNVPTFALRLFNPDGSEFEKSGNGLRIFAALPVGPRPAGRSGFRHPDARRRGDGARARRQGTQIAMDMGRLSFLSTDIGIAGPTREVVGEEVIGRGPAVCGSSA